MRTWYINWEKCVQKKKYISTLFDDINRQSVIVVELIFLITSGPASRTQVQLAYVRTSIPYVIQLINLAAEEI